MAVTIILKSGYKVINEGTATVDEFFRNMSTKEGATLSITDDNGHLRGFIVCSEVAAVLEMKE
ncbi:hypothetical protein P9G84_22480 [Brevibacillus centrosporus]|uniref:hypothetical protein n=1 Tax=Brevibacillus centrosporus TaxID=54910 RepID=UPI000F09EDEA|nr:hypothetical protein [Brevibacillus centrosporus]MEC2131696.1 hypothetical protein [Brevibacillus centrosporus]RNB67343.1 hypothetical protein EDM55_20060 [Brevibacillus centrosporus]GED34008.1 hypothetical protein BCE02nite_51490 [Brevibacillus centrosporus]